MKLKRLIATILLISTIAAMFSMTVFTTSAASGTGYDSADDVVYNKSDSYIYNWGSRGEDCVFLSTYAQAFYTGIYVYDDMSQTQGGTSQSNAHNSALYVELKDLMTNKHSYRTSYDATKNLYKYTDCENGGGKISSFYSGTAIGPNWGSSPTWNREHTWPNSKGLGGSDENDIMMLRPTAQSENSSRGNTAYGKSSGYYNPNKESGGTYDLRGDVARITLYVYTRWGNTSYMWGSSGVMENLNVLLEWMEADPVDTWEMGRNDAVQSITGTRNVFVDYPEYAWLLFGVSLPSNMTTPSGEASEGATGGPVIPDCQHTNTEIRNASQATCTSNGYSGDTYCKDCEKKLSSGTSIPATGHNYVGSTCTVCSASKPSGCELVTSSSAIQAGDQIIIACNGKSTAMGGIVNNKYAESIDVTINDNLLTVADGIKIITVEAGTTSGTWALKTDEGYLYWSSGNSILAGSDPYDWNITINNNTATITSATTPARSIQYNASAPRFACYQSTQTAISIYKVSGTLLRGDVNADGSVDSDDAIYLLRYTLNAANYPINQDGDMNGDGSVDSDDAIYLLRHTLNAVNYPLS